MLLLLLLAVASAIPVPLPGLGTNGRLGVVQDQPFSQMANADRCLQIWKEQSERNKTTTIVIQYGTLGLSELTNYYSIALQRRQLLKVPIKSPMHLP